MPLLIKIFGEGVIPSFYSICNNKILFIHKLFPIIQGFHYATHCFFIFINLNTDMKMCKNSDDYSKKIFTHIHQQQQQTLGLRKFLFCSNFSANRLYLQILLSICNNKFLFIHKLFLIIQGFHHATHCFSIFIHSNTDMKMCKNAND